MTSFTDSPSVVNELMYGEDGKKEAERLRGVGRESVLWAVILELRCSKCDAQDRWRGRSHRAVATVARALGWKFIKGKALCAEHASRKDRKNILGVCTYRQCKKPIFVVPRIPGSRGRPTNKCREHYFMFKRWTANREAKVTRTAPFFDDSHERDVVATSDGFNLE